MQVFERIISEKYKSRNLNKTLSYFSSLFLGGIFLFSAFAKAWNGNEFADIVLEYGPSWLSIFAPIVISTETIIGTMLLVRLHLKQTFTALIIFTASVSAVYLYGVLFRQVTDCGCFGRFEVLNTNPWFTFGRNIVFIGIALLGIHTTQIQRTNLFWRYPIVLLFSSLATFLCGISMSKTFQLPPHTTTSNILHRHIEETILPQYLLLSNDSTYIVYLFSFSCAHCQNSFANVEQYQSLALADQVYGLAIEDAESRARFERIYRPTIPIYTISKSEMNRLTHEIPVLLLIRNGSIENMEVGSVTSPGIFVE